MENSTYVYIAPGNQLFPIMSVDEFGQKVHSEVKKSEQYLSIVQSIKNSDIQEGIAELFGGVRK